MIRNKKNTILIIFLLGITILFLFFVSYAFYSFKASKEFSQGQTSFDSKDWQTAYQHLDKVTAFYKYSIPSHREAAEGLKEQCSLLLNAEEKQRQGEYINALDLFTTYADRYPESAAKLDVEQIESEIYVQWMIDLRAKSNFDQAYEKSQMVLTKYPDSSAADTVNNELPSLLISWAGALNENEKYDEAIQKLTEIIDQYPETELRQQAVDALPDIYLSWAAQLRNDYQSEAALELYQLILKDYGDTPAMGSAYEAVAPTLLEWAEFLRSENKPGQALEKYQILLTQWKGTQAANTAAEAMAPTMLEWARAADEQKDYAEEVNLLVRLITLYAVSEEAAQAKQLIVPAYDSYGKQLIEEGSYILAMDIYKSAEQLTLNKEEKALISEGFDVAFQSLVNDTGTEGQKLITDTFASACEGMPASSPAVGAATKQPAKGMLCYGAATGFSFPYEWYPNTPGDFRYVIDITSHSFVMQTCNYTNNGQIERFRNSVIIKLINTKTGAQYKKGELFGSLPAACPQAHVFSTTYEKIEGSDVNSQQIHDWLEPIFAEKKP